MNIRRRRHTTEVPTHAMNDIMFFLLLFFLILATMTNPYMIKIYTAGAGKLTPEERKSAKYELSVTAEKEYIYNNRQVDLEELQKLLKVDHTRNDSMVLTIDLDLEVDIQEMVDVLSICTEEGIKYFLKDPRT